MTPPPVQRTQVNVEARAEELFQTQYDINLRRTDRLFSYLLVGQWIFAIALAAFISPYAWAGKTHVINFHVYIAVFGGLLLNSMPLLLVRLKPGWLGTRCVIAVSQMLWAAMLIHLTGGRIETHFHVFGSLAFLAFYRDWRVLIPATVVVAADHLIRQIFWPESVYGILNPVWWRFLEHAAWVIFEDTFLIISCLASVRDMRNVTRNQAKVEVADRLESEMKVAQGIQTSLLPRNLKVQGFQVAAKMVPATEVGGDYYDIMPAHGGCWMAVGDVSGHGLASGLIMLQAQSALGALVRQLPDSSPRDILEFTNHLLVDNIRVRMSRDDHMTLSLLRYHEDGSVVMAGAHEEFLICRAASKRCEILPTLGTWLGVRNDSDKFMVESKHRLLKNDVMVLYTDGITEAMNAQGVQFGLERLAAEVERLHDKPVEQISDGILATVTGWTSEQADDMTVVVLRYAA